MRNRRSVAALASAGFGRARGTDSGVSRSVPLIRMNCGVPIPFEKSNRTKIRRTALTILSEEFLRRSGEISLRNGRNRNAFCEGVLRPEEPLDEPKLDGRF